MFESVNLTEFASDGSVDTFPKGATMHVLNHEMKLVYVDSYAAMTNIAHCDAVLCVTYIFLV